MYSAVLLQVCCVSVFVLKYFPLPRWTYTILNVFSIQLYISERQWDSFSPSFSLHPLISHVPGSWFLMGQDQSFIPVSLNLPLAYKVKAYGQNPKQQWPIISQGNWLLIGNNNRIVWGWRERTQVTEGSIKNDWSMSHSRRIGWTGIEAERDHGLPTTLLELTDCSHSCFHPFLPSFHMFLFHFLNSFSPTCFFLSLFFPHYPPLTLF